MRYLYATLFFLISQLYAESANKRNKNLTIQGTNVVKELKQRNEYNKWLPMYKTIKKFKKELFLDEDIKESLKFIGTQVSNIAILNITEYKIYSCKLYESELCIDFKANVKQIIKGEFDNKANIIITDDYDVASEIESIDMIAFIYKEEKRYYGADILAYRDANQNYINYLIKLFHNHSRNRININNSTYKSLYSFCKATGIKESEIRALNPWINKKATNIPPNAEIIIPNLTKEENNESN